MKQIPALAAALVSAAAALAAHAQAPANSETDVITNTKPQLRAQAKDNAKPDKPIRQAGGDEVNSPESSVVSNTKSANAGQARIAVRNAKHPNRPPAGQGGTPD